MRRASVAVAVGATLLLPAAAALVASSPSRLTRARALVQDLVEEQACFTTEAGARAFGDLCAANAVYEDCLLPPALHWERRHQGTSPGEGRAAQGAGETPRRQGH